MARKKSKNLPQKKNPAKPRDGQKRKPYRKPVLEKHSEVQLWAFGTMGG